MSDIAYLHEKPLLVYGGTESADLFTIIDTSDGNRIKQVTQEDLIKIILGGKTLGGTGSADVTTNNASQTITNKILIDPSIRYTPNGGGTVVTLDNEEVGTLVATLKAGGVEDGARLVEATENITKQSFCAYFTQEADGTGALSVSAVKLFTESGVDSTGRTIDLRSCVVSVLGETGGSYKPATGYTYVLNPRSAFTLDIIDFAALTPSATYYICVHFRVTEA
jgi:hypothetical protein